MADLFIENRILRAILAGVEKKMPPKDKGYHFTDHISFFFKYNKCVITATDGYLALIYVCEKDGPGHFEEGQRVIHYSILKDHLRWNKDTHTTIYVGSDSMRFVGGICNGFPNTYFADYSSVNFPNIFKHIPQEDVDFSKPTASYIDLVDQKKLIRISNILRKKNRRNRGMIGCGFCVYDFQKALHKKAVMFGVEDFIGVVLSYKHHHETYKESGEAALASIKNHFSNVEYWRKENSYD